MDNFKFKKNKCNFSISHQPWSNFNEWKTCYDSLFNNSYNKAKKVNKIEENLDTFINNLSLPKLELALSLLKVWKIRHENRNLVLTSILLVEEIIKIKSKAIYSNEDNQNILSQKIIRVTNLIIDDLKKKKNLASNMFLIAKEIDFPEFIVEVRHSCTHKNLPQVNTLKFVIKYLYFWVKQNIWDKQYNLFIEEIDTFNKFVELLNSVSTKKFEVIYSEIENNIQEVNIKFEIENLYFLIRKSFDKIYENIEVKNGQLFLINLSQFSKFYKLLQGVEGKLVSLLYFKLIMEQIQKFTMGFFDNIDNYITYNKTKENILQNLSFISNFVVKFDLVKDEYLKEDLKKLIMKIYKNLNFSKDFHNCINEILNYFKILINEKVIELEQVEIPNDDSQLIKPKSNLQEGSLIYQQLNFLAAGNKPEDWNKENKTSIIKAVNFMDIPSNEIQTDLINKDNENALIFE